MSSFNELARIFRNIINDLFNSNGFECRKLIYGKDIYYCARDILKCLHYADDKKSISACLRKLRDQDKFTIEQLEQLYSGSQSNYDHDSNINKDLIDSLNQYERNYIFINKSALYFLIGNSNKIESRPFKDFIYYTLLPALDNKYEELINQKNEKIDELSAKIDEILRNNQTLLDRTQTLIADNQTLIENTEILKKDNEDIINELTDVNEELYSVSEKQDELINTIETVLVPNRNLPPRDNRLRHSFVLFRNDDKGNTYYFLRGQNKYIQKRLKDKNIRPENIVINSMDNPNPIDFCQKFKEESQARFIELERTILEALHERIPNFDPNSEKGERLIAQNIRKRKGFAISGNILRLNNSSIDDVLEFYNSLLQEKTEY